MIIQGPNAPMMMASTASVQSWLGEELETRGVDAVVYTRYILSIFQQDSFDLEQDPELCGTASVATVGTQSALLPAIAQGGHSIKSSCNLIDGSGGTGNYQRHNHHHHHPQHHCHHQQQLQQSVPLKRDKGRSRMKTKNQHLRWQTPEDLKKDAVVKCLQSVTEKDCGIEGLVEELCLKLKKVQEERKGSTSPALSPDATTQTANHCASQEKYSEAFPALSGKPKGTDIKLKGVWKSKTKRNNSTGSISAPSSDREVEQLEDKSASASVSRNSSSPVGFQGRQYQRAQSLPSSLSKNKNKSPTFVVPKYQGRKGHQGHRNYGHTHDKGNRRHHLERDWGGHGMEKGDGRFKSGSGRKKRDIYPEWYQESGEGMADLAHFDGKDVEHRGDVYEEVFTEVKELNGRHNAVKEEEKLEEAVSTMAESLCRSIIEEWDDDKPLAKLEGKNDGLLMTEGDTYMIGNGDGLKVWRAGSTRTADLNEISMAPVAVDGPRHASLSIWEKNLVPGSPLCAGQQEPWENNARSCLPTASSLNGVSPTGAANILESAACLTSPKSIHEDSAADEASDTMSLAEELRVDVDQVHLDSAPISPRNAPIGTGRNADSLLRICDHTHAHSLSYDPQGTCSQTGVGWDNSCDEDQGAMHSTPAKSGLPNDQPFSAEEDSIVHGICISQKEGSLFNISTEAHSLDMNNAMWATYENKQPQVQPPKIVTWDEGIFTGCHPLAKVSAFIEGGVYGSPYSSRNNSQFNSCSTSPCNESSIRELWEGPQSREASSACSLECLLSPQPCGQSCSSIQDEQSIIEDSLVDSPKYLCSRSSSRFEFARSDAENSDDSSPHGTETDEMISEDEWADELHKDARESSKSGAKEKLGKHEMDDVKDSKATRSLGGSLNSHPDSSAESHQGSSANSQLGFCVSSFGSGKGTVFSEHQPVDWKKHDTLSVSPGTRTVKTIHSRKMPPTSSSQNLMTSDLHFKPIQLDQGFNVEGGSEGLLEPMPFTSQYGYYQEQNQFGCPAYPQMPEHPDECRLEDSWKVPESTSQTFLVNRGTDQLSHLDGQTSKLSMPSHKLFPDYAATCGSTGPGAKHAAWSQDTAVGQGVSYSGQSASRLCDSYGGGAGAGPGDPGGGASDVGGGGGYQQETWSCHGLRPRMQYGYDPPCFPDEDELFLHEGLLVDQPLEVHTSHRLQNKHSKRGGSNAVCKEFLEGRCSSSLCMLSHDASRVTCGQWLEGRCQRGALCQFMHGYTSNLSSQDSSRDGSRTGSTTPDDADSVAWEHQRPAIPHASDWVVVPSNRETGNHGSGKGVPSHPRDGARGREREAGASNGGEHLRSLPINISSKNR